MVIRVTFKEQLELPKYSSFPFLLSPCFLIANIYWYVQSLASQVRDSWTVYKNLSPKTLFWFPFWYFCLLHWVNETALGAWEFVEEEKEGEKTSISWVPSSHQTLNLAHFYFFNLIFPYKKQHRDSYYFPLIEKGLRLFSYLCKFSQFIFRRARFRN